MCMADWAKGLRWLSSILGGYLSDAALVHLKKALWVVVLCVLLYLWNGFLTVYDPGL